MEILCYKLVQVSQHGMMLSMINNFVCRFYLVEQQKMLLLTLTWEEKVVLIKYPDGR